MDTEASAASTTEASPSSESRGSSLAEVWVELTRSPDGIGLTAYREYEDGEVVVADEAWWTWPEFTGITDEALQISETRCTELTALDGGSLLTAGNILDVIVETDLTLVDFSDPIGEIGNEPVYDEMEVPSEDTIRAELAEALPQ